MAKKQIAEPELELEDNIARVKVATVHERTIINGHVLPVGCVTEMTQEDVERHRAAGVPLHDVEEGDDREVYDTSEPFVSEDNG